LGSRGYPEWANLTRALVTGKRQSEGIPEEEDLFSGLYRDPERMKIFLQGMTSTTTRFAQSIAREFPWKEYNTFVDVGCAQGTLPVQLALAHQHLHGTGFDLPIIRPYFDRYVRSFGLGDRLRFMEGDFFKDEL